MLGPLNINLAEYGVSVKNGFLPDELPLERLQNSYFSEWEVVVDNLEADIETKTIRSKVRIQTNLMRDLALTLDTD